MHLFEEMIPFAKRDHSDYGCRLIIMDFLVDIQNINTQVKNRVSSFPVKQADVERWKNEKKGRRGRGVTLFCYIFTRYIGNIVSGK